MRYLSTRDNTLRYTAAEAIKQGLSREGGLFLPEQLPRLTAEQLTALQQMSYQDRAVEIMSLFLEDYSREELKSFADAAYGPERFDDPAVAPVRTLDGTTHCLELWHGPTSAFKDMALQMLPHLLYASLGKTGEEKTVCILVATSGDTGKAALEGFRDVDHTRIMVFYPKDGVSAIQKLQMVTQEGGNVGVCAVAGNFDDAQTGVKRIFSDEAMRSALLERGYFLSSANSINWGRVLPQIVYYVSLWCDLTRDGKLGPGEKLNICVPTGNFGNILSAYYAKCMGVPIGKLICASNKNDVLTEFLRTGVYDRNRTFYTTMSPSMDILISSNLERLVYLSADCDTEQTRRLMAELSADGAYQVTPEMRSRMEDFRGGYATEAENAAGIRHVYDQTGYLIDTHTGVASTVYRKYVEAAGDHTPTIIASTASPYKFSHSVMEAVFGDQKDKDEFTIIDDLCRASRVPIPQAVEEIRNAQIRHNRECDPDQMEAVVAEILGLDA